MTTEDIDQKVKDQLMLLETYMGQTNRNLKGKLQELSVSIEDNKKELEQLIKDILRDSEHSDYIKYLMSDDFNEKEKKLIEDIEQLIADKIPKPNNNILYIYMVLAALFVLQIALLITR
jgi:phosphoribosyl-ATP pyrophosphohydrolase